MFLKGDNGSTVALGLPRLNSLRAGYMHSREPSVIGNSPQQGAAVRCRSEGPVYTTVPVWAVHPVPCPNSGSSYRNIPKLKAAR